MKSPAPAGRRISAALARRILATVRKIPRGRVATYGWVAERAGLPRRARLVGQALRETPSGTRVPWHRVINAQGRISLPRASHAHAEQRQRLEREGVVFIGGRINLRKYGWRQTLDELLWGGDWGGDP
jgi:methylated-DNA-protein-cysteine methyltransferase related protein